jgi:hypothetical protein
MCFRLHLFVCRLKLLQDINIEVPRHCNSIPGKERYVARHRGYLYSTSVQCLRCISAMPYSVGNHAVRF